MFWWNVPGISLTERFHYLMVDTSDGYNVFMRVCINLFLTIIGIDALLTQDLMTNFFIMIAVLAVLTFAFSYMDANPVYQQQYKTPPPTSVEPRAGVRTMDNPFGNPHMFGNDGYSGPTCSSGQCGSAGRPKLPNDPYTNPQMFGGASDSFDSLFFGPLADPTLHARPGVYWSQPTRPDVHEDTLAYARR